MIWQFSWTLHIVLFRDSWRFYNAFVLTSFILSAVSTRKICFCLTSCFCCLFWICATKKLACSCLQSPVRQIPRGDLQEYFEFAIRYHDHGTHHCRDPVKCWWGGAGRMPCPIEGAPEQDLNVLYVSVFEIFWDCFAWCCLQPHDGLQLYIAWSLFCQYCNSRRAAGHLLHLITYFNHFPGACCLAMFGFGIAIDLNETCISLSHWALSWWMFRHFSSYVR